MSLKSLLVILLQKKNLARLVKAREFHTLPNLCMLCLDEGFDDFDIRYVSGLWVMLEFKTKEACKNFMLNDAINHWVMEKRAQDRNFIPTDRIVWVDIEGITLCAWSKSMFRNIVAKW